MKPVKREKPDVEALRRSSSEKTKFASNCRCSFNDRLRGHRHWCAEPKLLSAQSNDDIASWKEVAKNDGGFKNRR